MTPLFKKLNYKQQEIIVCLNAPKSFSAELEAMKAYAGITETIGTMKTISFAIAFVTRLSEIEKYAKVIDKKLTEDGIVWFCYPKGTSKNYTCEFNRDTGWQFLGDLGYEPVRIIALDADWSALRFRKPSHIKKMTRSFAMTKEGKAKVTQSQKQKQNGNL